MSTAITRGLMLYLAVLVLGCGRAGDGTDTSRATGAADAESSTAEGTPGVPDAPPPRDDRAFESSEIPDPQMWNEPARLADFLKTVPLEKNERRTTKGRHCKSPSDPESMRCVLVLQGATRTGAVNPDSLPAGGVVLGRIRLDTGAQDDDSWTGIRRGRTYFWAIRPDKGKEPRSYFVDASTGVPLASPAGRAMRLKYCHDDKHGGESYGFYCCNGTCPKDLAPPSVHAPKPGFDAHTTPPWISCKNGCCYADWE